jgi:mono/diheme cytochrome c family protein
MRGVRKARGVDKRRLGAALGGALALLIVRPATAHDPITTKVTFDREIRAILQARCATCHAAGRPAPMPLTTFDEVRPWARAIKDQILTRRMPIWNAAHGYGAFANDPSLTPAEMAIVAAWVDGGMPVRPGPPSSAGSPGSTGAQVVPALSALRRNQAAVAISVPASAAEATVPLPSAWIASWDFEPGDPLITSAAFASADGAAIGTWVAGDGVVSLPADAGMAVTSPIRITLQRRKAEDYERPFTPVRSLLRVVPLTDAPARRVWVEEAACGTPRTKRRADLLAVRPLLANGASARMWLERPGAPRVIIGWFRDVDARHPRAYWLARATDLSVESRIQADAPCSLELTLAGK